MNIKAISLFEKTDDPNGIYVNTTSKSESDWQRDLSPFYLGPCPLYWDFISQRMENGWQYSKVYPEYDNKGEPTESYFDWAVKGWNNPNPVRYPMGKGKKPLYSWWDGKKYTYVEGRKKIYVPLYARSVVNTNGFRYIQEMVEDKHDNRTLYLRDYDAYRHEDKGMTLTQVLNCTEKKCGHAFVLMMLLTKDEAILQCDL
jgi:hypothetical protein